MKNNNWLTGLFITTLFSASVGTASAQVWPQDERSYMPSTKSPQWIENNTAVPQAPAQVMPHYAPQPQFYRQPAPYGMAQPPMPYGAGPMNGFPRPGYPYQPGYAQPFNWSMPNMPTAPNMGTPGWGNWPNMSMPDMSFSPNMPSMPNMNNFPSPTMPSPSFDMPSPSFNMPSMPFFN